MVDPILSELLVCPACHGDMNLENSVLRCRKCQAQYSVNEGIPCFSEPESEFESDPADIAFRKDYEWRYHNDDDARAYDDSFKKSFRKRRRTNREKKILNTMLSSQGHSKVVLDVPCGGGRLSEPIAQSAEHLIEADISPAQLDLALSLNIGNQHGIIASALQLPFKTASVDGVVNSRLSHHLPNADEREQLLLELLRVAKRFVIFSFTDKTSLKSFSRKLRGKEISQSAMDSSEVENIARKGDAELRDLMTVSVIGQRHRFALLEKSQPE